MDSENGLILANNWGYPQVIHKQLKLVAAILVVAKHPEAGKARAEQHMIATDGGLGSTFYCFGEARTPSVSDIMFSTRGSECG